MSEKDNIEKFLQRTGQSQSQRMPAGLDVHFADVDERTTEDLMLFAGRFAEFVKHYNDTISGTSDNWKDFFPAGKDEILRILEQKDGKLTPHLALFVSFLELYKVPQEVINRITGGHLNFYFKDVLHLAKKPAIADKVHTVIELKKNENPTEITPIVAFSAGKDDTKAELLYYPTGTTIINNSTVSFLCSVFVDTSDNGTVRFAPVANSADGKGKKFENPESKWPAFGNENMPEAGLGFALSSPVLRMKEGTRKVNLNLVINGNTETDISIFDNAFEAYITGEKGWIGPLGLTLETGKEGEINLSFTINQAMPAIVDFSIKVHSSGFDVAEPVLQVMLKKDNTGNGYNLFKDIEINSLSIQVEVSGYKSLQLRNDLGNLDPKKAFMPFGPQPVTGSKWIVGCDEALSKSLSEISIDLNWKDAPANFSNRYANYTTGVDNPYFKAAASFEDGGDWTILNSPVQLFETTNASAAHSILFSRIAKHKPAKRGKWLHYDNSLPVRKLVTTSKKETPLVKRQEELRNRQELLKDELHLTQIRTPDPGIISLVLKTGFLQEEYRKLNTENILNFSKSPEGTTITLINEPYIPVVQEISLSYKAQSDVALVSKVDQDHFLNDDIQFHHIGCFGQMREHAWLRNNSAAKGDKTVFLLPRYANEGELMIGLQNLSAGESVSILFQVAEGSEEPSLMAEKPVWSVLSDNFWHPLDTAGVVLDTTNRFLRSGIVKFVIPSDATTQNTLMPPGLLWLKASVPNNTKACCQLLDVLANAVEVSFRDNNNDPAHLKKSLESKRITKLKESIPAIKSISQPYSSFGGRSMENDNTFYTRVSERLRHKDRCISPWDYERMVLEEFPAVHKVKCIPHAAFIPSKNSYCWYAPGNVVIVVVPDLRNKNAVDPLKPRHDSNTLSLITDFVNEHSGMQVKVKVKNPEYQKIQLRFSVKFHKGFEFNYYSNKLKAAIKEYLTPWAYESGVDAEFGGKIYKSVLLNFVEEQEYVDYVTDFRLTTLEAGSLVYTNAEDVLPSTPDSIFVSDDTHLIYEIK